MSENAEKSHATALGLHLRNLRMGHGLSLREVEVATDNQVSNPYLSQLENGKIFKPSPHILHALSRVYGVEYENLMERAGYFAPAQSKKKSGQTRLRNYSIDNLTADEEKELLSYLEFWRRKQKREKS